MKALLLHASGIQIKKKNVICRIATEQSNILQIFFFQFFFCNMLDCLVAVATIVGGLELLVHEALSY
jgi:hypothetical protein